MSQHMPNGPGVCYQKNEQGFFEYEPMVSGCSWSYESMRWLAYMETQPPFNSTIKIQHALNGGEKEINVSGRRYKVDGYAEIEGIKYLLEFDGCRFHRHSCQNSKRSNIPQKDDRQRNKDLSNVGVLLRIYECEWLKMKTTVKINIGNFFGRKNICASEIMGAVANGVFYGIIQCDIISPPSVIEHFLKLNHPPIFAHVNLDEDMVGPTMKSLLKDRGAKYPLEKQLSLVFHHKQYTMTTDLARFYMNMGMELSNLSLAIEFKKSKPLANFVDTVTEKRKQATRLGDDHLQNTWKLIMNSSYGRTTLNLLKRRAFKYVKPSDAPTLDENPFTTNVCPVQGEFETDFLEVCLKKRKITDKVPGDYRTYNQTYLYLKIKILIFDP